MRVIAKKRLMTMAAKHPASTSSVTAWFKVVSKTNFPDFDSIRVSWPSASMVAFKRKIAGAHGVVITGHYTVFNINGNNLRLITVIYYNKQRIYIRKLLTHAEYDKVDLKKGKA